MFGSGDFFVMLLGVQGYLYWGLYALDVYGVG